MKQISFGEKPTPETPLEGIGAAGWGHHGIGMTGENGTYTPVNPKMKIRMAEEACD